MTTTIKTRPPISIRRADQALPILQCLAGHEISIRPGTEIVIDGQTHDFSAGDVVVSGTESLLAGCDYGVVLDTDGRPHATLLDSNPLDGIFFGGFHFAPGGNAEARAGGSTTPAINPASLWDVDFRPSCPDPRGMVLIETAVGKRFWADIYLLGVDHAKTGTSIHGAVIADGRSLDRLDYPTTVAIYAGHGKRLLTYDEFRVAAFGVTERSSADRDPKSTGLDALRTSHFGLMQATGNLWVWGNDGDADDPRPSIFGGSWILGEDAGSRCADLGDWPGASDVSISARGACDHLNPA